MSGHRARVGSAGASTRARRAAPKKPLPPSTPDRDKRVAALLESITSPVVRERVDFIHRHVIVKTGERFDLTDPRRRWVIDEYFAAVDGFKLWPRVPDIELCEWCAPRAGTIVDEWQDEDDAAAAAHAAENAGCPGLKTEPILLSLINVPRQDGKTSSSMGYTVAVLFKARNKAIAFVAAAKDQTSRLFDESWRNAIASNPALETRCTIVGDTLHVPETNSKMWMLATSGASSTGSSATHVLYDEARDVPPDVFMALLPSIFARSGFECPIPGHYHVEGDSDRARCPKCSKKLRPWFGRTIATSSSAVEGDAEDSWFGERVEYFEKNPHPNVHVYKRDTSSNPAIKTRYKMALGSALESSPALRPYVMAEIYNQRTRKGEDFVSPAHLERALRRDLKNERASTAPTVGVLDASIVGDLTSLVLLAPRTEDWLGRLYTSHIFFWDPAHQAQGLIDDRAVLAYLDELLVGFPALVGLAIDTRGMPWAAKMFKTITESTRPWGRRVESIASWDKGAEDNGWTVLEEHIVRGTIEIQDLPVIRSEFQGIKKRRNQDGTYKVVDKNREKRHRDVTASLSAGCYMTVREAAKKEITLAQLEARRPASMLERMTARIPRIREEDL